MIYYMILWYYYTFMILWYITWYCYTLYDVMIYYMILWYIRWYYDILDDSNNDNDVETNYCNNIGRNNDYNKAQTPLLPFNTLLIIDYSL